MVETGTGTIRLASNVEGLEGRRFGEEPAERLGHAVTVENDVNLGHGAERHDMARDPARASSATTALAVGLRSALDSVFVSGRDGPE